MDEYFCQRLDIESAKLPARIRELLDLIGLEQTLKLLKKYGGSVRYIPKHVDSRSSLLEVISQEALLKLSTVYFGEAIELPKPDHIYRQMRNQEIIEKTQQGVSRAELVDHYQLSRRQIGNIRRQYKHSKPLVESKNV